MLRRVPAQRGMNIIEMMVAVAIVGMVMAMAGPYALVWIQNTQLRNAAEGVLSGVQNARVEALKRNTFVSFQLTDANSTAFQTCLYDPIANGCQGGANAILATRSASEGSLNARVASDTVASDPTAALGPGSGVPGQVTFDTFGRLASTAPNNMLRIDVRNTVAGADERRLVIIIGLGGQIRMCDPKLSKATNPQGCV
jgi:type IV fimbrial biogenesis protein FimT